MNAITIISDNDDDNINKLHLQFIGLYTLPLGSDKLYSLEWCLATTLFRNVLMTN